MPGSLKRGASLSAESERRQSSRSSAEGRGRAERPVPPRIQVSTQRRRARGRKVFSASATIQQTKNPTHPEAYGMFFTGNKLNTPDQTYYYFLVRGDGKVLVNHRAGKDVHKIMDWTDNAAVHKADAKGVAANTLSVDATKTDSVRLLVNGVQVAALPGAHAGSTDGYVGLRVNHNLDVHISDFVVTPKTK